MVAATSRPAFSLHPAAPSPQPAIDKALPELGITTPALTKPHGDLMTFFNQTYKVEHSNDTSRLLHVIGTGLVILVLLWKPAAAVSMVSALGLGMAAFPYLRYQPNGLVEFAVVGVTFVLLTWRSTKSLMLPIAIMVCGYGFAWVGHFVFEKNQPATFIYPSFSLASDFIMFGQTVSGRWPIDFASVMA